MSTHVSFRAWRSGGFDGGVRLGTADGPGGLVPVEPVGVRTYDDPYGDLGPRTYEWAAWLSPAVSPGHPFTEVVPSWNARTPEDSWLEVEARTSSDGVHWSRWYSLGRWAETDAEIHATSVPGQKDETARVDTDVLVAEGTTTWTSYQLKVTLLRRAGSPTVPSVSLLAAVVSQPGEAPPVRTQVSARGVELPVPAYSQMVHRGEYPHWGPGGEAWCSPTSVSMVLGRWGAGPTETQMSWVLSDHPDRFVDYAARHVFDHAYGGAGNWSFNTAYAARYGTEAFVTRLRSLDEVELLVGAGVPVVASVSFRRDQLDRAGYDTSGHLLVVVGFDADGDVVCNDPASHELPSNDEVRVVYDRAQFEKVWLGPSDGLVYVIRPHDVPLPPPADPSEPNW